MAEHHVYKPLEAPDLEVLVDGQWWPAEGRMRTTHDDGRLIYNATWHRDGQQYVDNFPADHVRLDTADRAVHRS